MPSVTPSLRTSAPVLRVNGLREYLCAYAQHTCILLGLVGVHAVDGSAQARKLQKAGSANLVDLFDKLVPYALPDALAVPQLIPDDITQMVRRIRHPLRMSCEYQRHSSSTLARRIS